MTTSEMFLIGFLIFQIVFALCFTVYSEWARLRMRRDLDEVRRCNDEFSEALELFQYGAIDEAVELARKWRERVEE